MQTIVYRVGISENGAEQSVIWDEDIFLGSGIFQQIQCHVLHLATGKSQHKITAIARVAPAVRLDKRRLLRVERGVATKISGLQLLHRQKGYFKVHTFQRRSGHGTKTVLSTNETTAKIATLPHLNTNQRNGALIFMLISEYTIHLH